jgi:hypothetical protein
MEAKYSIDSYIDFPLLMCEIVDDTNLDFNHQQMGSNKSIKNVKWCLVKNKIVKLDIDCVLKDKISKLPIDIQKKLCIYTWRGFWRDYVPLTAKVPLWYTRKLYIENRLFEARNKNVHFMHLEFNTLPENKKWIMGCQCKFCLDFECENELECHSVYTEEYDNSVTFENIMPSGISSDWNRKWYFITNDIDSEQPMAGYDPLYGTEFENFTKWAIRENIKIKFSDDI